MKNAKRAVGKGSYCAGTDARSHDEEVSHLLSQVM